jgi:hypothetical protein
MNAALKAQRQYEAEAFVRRWKRIEAERKICFSCNDIRQVCEEEGFPSVKPCIYHFSEGLIAIAAGPDLMGDINERVDD